MPTTFANTIDGNEILAKRSQCDYAGNDIQTTYATKSELPSASQLVPASTSADADKVLTVDSQGIPGWAAGGSGGGGNVFMATSTTTFPELWQAFYEEGKIVYCTEGSASSLTTPYFLQKLKAYDSGHTTGTATFVQFNRYSTGRIEVYHATVAFDSNRPTLGTVTFTRQIVVPDYPGSHVGEYLTAQSNGDMTFATVNQVPASTSADADKVLTVDSLGVPGWAVIPPQPTGLFQATYGTSTYNEVRGAVLANKIVYCYVNGRMAFLAYIASNNYEFQYYRSNSSSYGTDSVFIYKVSRSGWETTERTVKAGNISYPVTQVNVNGASAMTGTVANITIPADETVLYQAATDEGTILQLDQYVTLSESMTHFERVRIYYAVQKPWTGKGVFESYMVDGDLKVNLHDVWYREQSGFNVWYETFTYNKYTDSNLRFTQAGGVQRAILNTTWNTTSGLTTIVYKIVGVHRLVANN